MLRSVSNELGLRLKAIIDTAIDGIITIDHKGMIESVNKSAIDLFGYKEEELVGMNVSILMPEPYRHEHDGYIERYNRTKEPHIIGIGREVEGKTKSGHIFPLRLAVSEVILNDRIIFTGIVHDLSAIKKTEDKLRKANEVLEEKVEERTKELEHLINHLLQTNVKLEKSELELSEALNKEIKINEMKSRFVSMASHEFRTPLSTIMSSVSLISRYKTELQDDKRMKHVDRIKSAVNNLTGILNDFLSLGQIEEGKIEINKTDIDLDKLCKEVEADVKGMLKNNQRIKHIFKGETKILHTDLRVLRNILFNLVSNAIKYSNEQIDCIIEYHKEFITISVLDRGIGIPLSEQEMLFERFFRASNVEMIQGTGLGLNIVKRYVSLLHGNIKFESEEGKGSKFTVTLGYK